MFCIAIHGSDTLRTSSAAAAAASDRVAVFGPAATWHPGLERENVTF